MIIVKLNSKNIEFISDLIYDHLGGTKLDQGYILYESGKIKGYALLDHKSKTEIKIDWIYADPGYGTQFLKRIERSLFKKYKKILLNVSLDPNENKNTVMRRMNFYIKNNYRVFDITYRKKYGSLLHMIKIKK